jgi:uncharacterized protein (TIGR04255 family)
VRDQALLCTYPSQPNAKSCTASGVAQPEIGQARLVQSCQLADWANRTALLPNAAQTLTAFCCTPARDLLQSQAMSTQHYTRAPITEALIDIHVRLPESTTLETLSRFAEAEPDYPNRGGQANIHWELAVSENADISTSASNTPLGYAFRSSDERRVVQARLNGFTFNWLKPYESWDALASEARRLWTVYRQLTHPEAVTRIGVRYTNRLELPLPLGDFREFLRTYPEVSADMLPGLSGYFMQLQNPQPDLDAMLILTQALLPQTDLQSVPVLLDIDLFQERNVPQEDDEIWKLLHRFRGRKNETFEACITNRIRSLIK